MHGTTSGGVTTPVTTHLCSRSAAHAHGSAALHISHGAAPAAALGAEDGCAGDERCRSGGGVRTCAGRRSKLCSTARRRQTTLCARAAARYRRAALKAAEQPRRPAQTPLSLCARAEAGRAADVARANGGTPLAAISRAPRALIGGCAVPARQSAARPRHARACTCGTGEQPAAAPSMLLRSAAPRAADRCNSGVTAARCDSSRPRGGRMSPLLAEHVRLCRVCAARARPAVRCRAPDGRETARQPAESPQGCLAGTECRHSRPRPRGAAAQSGSPAAAVQPSGGRRRRSVSKVRHIAGHAQHAAAKTKRGTARLRHLAGEGSGRIAAPQICCCC